MPVTTCAPVLGWLDGHRRANDVRPWQRAATCWVQVHVLRWLQDGTTICLLARDAKISQATAYRYLHEVMAAHVPDLHKTVDPYRTTQTIAAALVLLHPQRSSR